MALVDFPRTCQRFDKWDKDYMAYGVGAFNWQTREDDLLPSMIILLPCPALRRGWLPYRIRCKAGDPRIEGGGNDGQWYHHWNGDRERPTVRASLGSQGWHGWLTDGILTINNPWK